VRLPLQVRTVLVPLALLDAQRVLHGAQLFARARRLVGGVREFGFQLRLALLRVLLRRLRRLLRRLRRLHLTRRLGRTSAASTPAHLRARRAQIGSTAAAGVDVAAHLA